MACDGASGILCLRQEQVECAGRIFAAMPADSIQLSQPSLLFIS
jgi:hypothetical protein